MEEKCVQRFLLCTYSTLDNVYKNSAVDLWIVLYLIDSCSTHKRRSTFYSYTIRAVDYLVKILRKYHLSKIKSTLPTNYILLQVSDGTLCLKLYDIMLKK